MPGRLQTIISGCLAAGRIGFKRRLLAFRHDRAARRIAGIDELAAAELTQATEACQQAADEVLRVSIENAPISRLEEYGIKTERLARFGYHRIGKLGDADEESLQRIPGIGKVRAAQIMTAFEQFVQDIKAEITILSPSGDHREVDQPSVLALARYIKVAKLCQMEKDRLQRRLRQVAHPLAALSISYRTVIEDAEARGEPLLRLELNNISTRELEQDLDKSLAQLRTVSIDGGEAIVAYQQAPETFRGQYRAMKIKPRSSY